MKETASFNSIFFLYETLRQMDCSVDVSLNFYRMAYTINRTISLEPYKALPKRFHLNGHTLHRILSTDSKVRTTLRVSIIDSGNERVNKGLLILIQNTNRNANKLHRYCSFISHIKYSYEYLQWRGAGSSLILYRLLFNTYFTISGRINQRS